jgi:hypothetical protein
MQLVVVMAVTAFHRDFLLACMFLLCFNLLVSHTPCEGTKKQGKQQRN